MSTKEEIPENTIYDEDYVEEEDVDDIPQTVSSPKEKSVPLLLRRKTYKDKVGALQDEIQRHKNKIQRLTAEKNMYKNTLTKFANDSSLACPIVMTKSFHVGDVNTKISNRTPEGIIEKVEHKFDNIKHRLQESNLEMIKMNVQLQQAKQTLNAVQSELGSLTKTDSETLDRVRFIQGLVELQTSPNRLTSISKSAIQSIRSWRNHKPTTPINELRFDTFPDDSKTFIKYIVVRFELHIEQLLGLLKTPSAVRDDHLDNEDLCCRAMVHWIESDERHDSTEFLRLVEEWENTIFEAETVKMGVTTNTKEDGNMSDTGNECLTASLCSSVSSVTDESTRRDESMELEKIFEILKKQSETLEKQQGDIEKIKEKVAPEPKRRVNQY